MRNSQWCLGYDPHQADTRRRRAAKGGKRGGRDHPALELASVKGQLQDLTDKVLAGEVERADASVSGQLLNIKKLRALETKRRWKELGEFEEGMVTVEAALEANKREQRIGSLKGRLEPDRESPEHPAGEAGAGTPAAPGATERPVECNGRVPP